MTLVKDKSTKRTWVAILASAGTLVAVGAIAINQGYVSTAFVLGTTAAELGVMSALLYVLAVLIYIF